MNKNEIVKILDEKVKRVDERFGVYRNAIDDLCLLEKDQFVCKFSDFKLDWFYFCAYEKNLNSPIEKVLEAISVFRMEYEKICIEKFYIRIFRNEDMLRDGEYLNLHITKKQYFFGTSDESWPYKTKFTNRDIEVMPDRIKKAISCGFLVKEEAYE